MREAITEDRPFSSLSEQLSRNGRLCGNVLNSTHDILFVNHRTML
jgi:hypothetical protein